MSRRIDLDSKTNRLRRELHTFPTGVVISPEDLQALAARIGLSFDYARLVVNGSGRHVRQETPR